MKKNDESTLLNSRSVKKLLLTMKLTFLLLLIGLMQVSASVYSQSTRFSFDLSDTKVVDVLKEIESKSEFRFFYQNEQIDVERKVNISVSDKTVEEILNELFNGYSIEYKIFSDKLILLGAEKAINNAVKDDLTSPQKTVSGTVTDEAGIPLPGVTVVVKGTTQGTVTNVDGYYSLPNVPAEATLQFSFVGMITQEVVVGNQSSINIQMETDAIGIEEVVAIGYGTRKKETLTGAISTIDSKTFETRPITSAINALQGTTSGLIVTRNSGQPGSQGLSIQLRGMSSINGGNSPLVLIDGLQSNLETINPDDIESISVLKDGTAAIYGNQASNGVILVTTKKGIRGIPKITYNMSYGFNYPTYIPEKTTMRQFMEMVNDGRINDGQSELFGEIFFDALGTDQVLNLNQSADGGALRDDSYLIFNQPENAFVNEFFETGQRQYHNLSVEGGCDNSIYRLSLGFLDENGVINSKYDDYKRYNIRLNNTFNIGKKLVLATQNSVELGDVSENSQLDLAYSHIMSNWTIMPMRRRLDGAYYTFRGFNNPNDLLLQGGEISTKNTRLISSFKLDYDITEELKLTTNFGINHLINKAQTKIPTIYLANTWNTDPPGFRIVPQTSPNRINESFATNNYMTMDAYLNYAKLINEENNVSLTVGASHEQRKYNYNYAESRNFPTNELLSLSLGDLDEARVNSNGWAWTIRSLFGRLNYEYKEKLIADAVLRADGSSRFTKEYRWGTFWGAMLAYRLSEDNFIKNLDFFDNLKIRVSYGETGNQEGIGYYDYLSLINVGSPIIFGPPSSMWGNQTENSYFVESGAVSTERSWETLATTNLGIDISILNSKLNASFDYYIKQNKNMLVAVDLPTVLGISPPALNKGQMETKGFELEVNWIDKIGNLNYYIKGTIFNDKNKLTSLQGSEGVKQEGINNRLVGYSIGTYFGWKFDGIIQNESELNEYVSNVTSGIPSAIEVGDVRYVDVDNNGRLSALGNPTEGDIGDLVELGNIRPQYSFSFNFGGDYKGFDFNVLFQGVGKKTLFKTGHWSRPILNWFNQGLKAFYGETWTQENVNAKYPRLSVDAGINDYNYRISENKKINGAYVRLKNIQIGYSIPKELLYKVKVDNLRLYISGEDLFEFQSQESRDFGFDPELGAQGFNYPFIRTFSLGTQITF
ncbi:TonB-dependent receptor [Maribellus maritimus]|uniref:TonB-dependent receptor n=1 Tax=Maribellus maritimus TaxID=2870838 RepID=UPI001EEC5FEB|nr:TonB-dependent receptor [Maribellus maritimus]MCG6187341.1 TonB-dependent receptor [Maribellus maritimus]